jgi:hypothetical protein
VQTTLSLLAGAILAGSAAAQVTVSGRIEPVGAPSLCAPAATHRIADTDVLLFSTTLDLSLVSTIPQVFSGLDVGAPGCPLLDVASIQSSKYSLSPCNTTALGCTFTLDQCPSPTAGVFLIAGSLGNGYLPLGSAGTILIDPLANFPVASGVQTAVCQSSPITLSGSSALIGVSVRVQALTVQTTGVLQLSNVTVVTVAPPGGCTSFACY